jgi:hypothetical protein
MTYTNFTPITIGSINWGVPLNTAIQNHDRAFNQTTPQDHDLLAWNFSVAVASGATGPTSGTVTMVKLWFRQALTVTNVAIGLGAAGVTLTAGQNFAGLYDSSGNRLGVTADQAANWVSSGFKEMALTVPVAVAAGAYYVAILSNGTTPPTLARGGILTASFANAKLTATTGAFTTGPAAQTTLPVSITMASRTLSPNPVWAGVS